MNESAVIALAGIGLAAIALQWAAWAVKLPAILFLLLAGIAAGPMTGLLDPAALFGDLLFPIVSLSVAVVLFEGALTLRFDEIRGLEKVVRNLVTIGVAVTWIVITLATRLALGFSWELSFLFGAVTVVTGPTVIVPMLRTVRPTAHIASVLRWEGIVIDPIGALLAVLVFEFIIAGGASEALGHTLMSFGRSVVIGLLFGAAAGYALGQALRRHWLPEYLHNVATLTLVFAVFAVSNVAHEESGLLTVTVMGMWLANMKGVPVDEIIDFKESLSVLLISILFIVLAARIEFAEFEELGWAALWIFLAIQFVARPLKVLVCTAGSSLEWRERALIGWIAPRGIVAAAMSALFAIRLGEAGDERAGLLAPLTFVVIIGTVTLQSVTARALAHALGVAEPEPKGFLIIGANAVARAVAKSLADHGFSAILSDTYWENIKKARMEGLAVYYGNPISEHADRHLDLVGIGRLMALSPVSAQNTVASMRYRLEFGAGAIYSILTVEAGGEGEKRVAAPGRRGMTLFGDDVTYTKLASLIGQGAEIRGTPLTDSFDMEAYRRTYGAGAIPLFALDTRKRLRVFTAEEELKPEEGWTIVSLIKEDAAA